MPHRLCNEPRCPNVARPAKAKCDTHMREYERERSARREATPGRLQEEEVADHPASGPCPRPNLPSLR